MVLRVGRWHAWLSLGPESSSYRPAARAPLTGAPALSPALVVSCPALALTVPTRPFVARKASIKGIDGGNGGTHIQYTLRSSGREVRPGVRESFSGRPRRSPRHGPPGARQPYKTETKAGGRGRFLLFHDALRKTIYLNCYYTVE